MNKSPPMTGKSYNPLYNSFEMNRSKEESPERMFMDFLDENNALTNKVCFKY